MKSNIVVVIEEIMETTPVMSRFFQKPKCKPWDIVRGKRFRCCHGLGVHTQWCMWVKVVKVPEFSNISVEDLING